MELTKHNSTLPVKLEELAQFVLFGREKLTAVRALIRAMDKLEVAAEVRQQKIGEAQDLADALLDAEVRIGELFKAMPKATGSHWEEKRENKSSTAATFTSKEQAAQQLGLDKHYVSRCQQLADNQDIVQQVKAEARDNDDIVNRSMALTAIKEREQIKNRFAEAVHVATNIETVQQGNEALVKVWDVQLGDVYLINGRHKLFVADSFDYKNIISQCEPIDACITDPPYGIGYKSPSGSGMTKRGDYNVIANDDTPFDPSILFNYCNKIVTWGANHYADKLPTSAGWLVWDKRDGDAINNNSDCELAWSNMIGSARLFHHKWNGMIKASEKNETRLHPTQKPIQLFAWCYEIVNAGEFIIDPFSGSGSSLIACDATGRTCFLVEMDTAFAAASLKRFSSMNMTIVKI